MNPTEDRRIIRTKEAIRAALVALIEAKGFEALSVKDITAKANINRGTFYLHYRDKFDLLDQTLEEVIKDIERIVLKITALSTADFADARIPAAVVVRLFQYVDDNAALMQAIMATKGNYALQSKMKKLMWSNIFEKNCLTLVKKEKFLVPGEYLASYIASAHFGVIQEWLDRGRQESPEEMARILINITFRGPLFAAGILP
ncbi:TetR/AcrR family transcriptional regulator [Desulfitobacterium chlororespirans]|uniref:Transcriptional regulator, TetR family n=1 Tax=Desulfitobacterium chlororespirans DSM 11544 TaxID=1121395 RepID=A0A1M7SD24_9FIRM|nr:TetR/AcrR family transcriptional regulator [Desulfitobacterium chlororespirans]SHN56389.1 transcriptional regulator, TetR family [Desulfitobacterium chlororespirans DSM 11544]